VPRFSDGGFNGGVHVPGLYQALLEKERRRCAKPDPRRIFSSDSRDDPAHVSRRSRSLLNVLEAGTPVVMPRWMVGSRQSVPPVDLPWDRSVVDSVHVSSDDVVRPAQSAGNWPGGAADDVDAREHKPARPRRNSGGRTAIVM
jgi:hypothetical protein